MRGMRDTSIYIYLPLNNFMWVYGIGFAWTQHKVTGLMPGFCAGSSANLTPNDLIIKVIYGVL